MSDVPNLHPSELRRDSSAYRQSALSRFAIVTGVIAGIGLAFYLGTQLFNDLVTPDCGITREQVELHAFCAALEAYKEDHGKYPSDPSTTDRLRPRADFDPSAYVPSSEFLYKVLSGDSDGDPTTVSPNDTKVYFEFRSDSLRPKVPGPGTYVVDPHGNSYGYSTFQAKNPKSSSGYNLTFDLWTTGGGRTSRERKKWSGNW